MRDDASRNKVLLTGFEPFGGDDVNESWEAVRAAGPALGPELDVVVDRLPVTFMDATRRIAALVEQHRPDVVVAVGLAAGTHEVRLERVAVNVVDARIPDNAGSRPVDEPVVSGGPVGYFSTLPIKAGLLALRAAGVPAGVSSSAGTYVCNATFYALQHALAASPEVRSGFVHVPRADVVSVEAASSALQIVVGTAVGLARGELEEQRVAAGTEH